MRETIGDIIKKLRKERGLTQESLAEQLNISSAAVSKWENNIGMPDISNVVPLANLFGVSADVLFGINNGNKIEEAEKALDEIFKMQENVKPEDEAETGLKIIEMYRDAIRRFPGNSTILCNAFCFSEMLTECNREEIIDLIGKDGVDSLIRQRISWAELVIKYSNDINDILCAKRSLTDLYAQQSRWNLASEITESFPNNISNTRDIRMADLMWKSGDKEKQQTLHCTNIKHLLEALGHQIIMLANLYREKEQYEEALYCYQTVKDLISSVYRNDEYIPPFHDKGYPLYLFPAYCLVKLNRFEEAVDLLEECVDYFKKQAKHYNRTNILNSPLLKKYSFSYGYEGTAVYKDPVKAAKDIILNPCFECLNNIPRYKKLREAL